MQWRFCRRYGDFQKTTCKCPYLGKIQKKIDELSNNYEFWVILKANQKTDRLKKNGEKMNKHYIKLNRIFTSDLLSVFWFVNGYTLREKGQIKVCFSVGRIYIISSGSNAVSQLWRNIILHSITHSQQWHSSCEQKFSKQATGRRSS